MGLVMIRAKKGKHMEVAEAKTLLTQAKAGFDNIVGGDPNGIPAEYIDYARSMSADIAAKVPAITDAAGIKALMAVQYKLVRFDTRAQRIIDAGAEGKGGQNVPGLPIPDNSTGARLVQHANTVIRVDKAFP